MSLTDDWKDGKLLSGWYYVRFNCYPKPKRTYYSKKNNEFSHDGKVEEILAPVPSYEEMQRLKHFDGKNVCLENEALKIKVERLIYLLKECKTHLVNSKSALLNFAETERLLTSVNAVIDESEE